MIDEKIRQLILNLTGNGLQVMSDGGTLVIGTYRSSEEVVLFVKDEGQAWDWLSVTALPNGMTHG
ncbi:MAG: hypothetical protein C4575_01245 [Desulforudis sp.]|nr:MAG: hypothetical protein C4575_01245 [Desulforudis sp.]